MVIYPFTSDPPKTSPFGSEPEVSRESDSGIMAELLRRSGKGPTGGGEPSRPPEDKNSVKIVNSLALQNTQTVAALNLQKQQMFILSEMFGVLKGIRNTLINGFEGVRMNIQDAAYDQENESDKESGIGDAAGGLGSISMWLSKPLTQISKLMMMPFNWLGGMIKTTFSGLLTTLGLKTAGAGAAKTAVQTATGAVEAGAGGVVGKTAQIAKAGKTGKMAEELGSVTKIFGKSFGKLGGLVKFIGKLAWPLMAVMAVFDFIGGMNKAGEVFEGQNGLKEKLAAGIGSVISGLTFGILDFEKTAKVVHKVFTWFGDIFKNSGMSENFGKMFSGIGDAFKDIFGVIKVLWDTIKPVMAWFWSVDMAILGVVGNVLMKFINFFVGAISFFARDLGNVIGIIGDLFGIIGGILTGDVDQIMENVYSIGDRFMDWLNSWVDKFKFITDLFGAGSKEEPKPEAPKEAPAQGAGAAKSPTMGGGPKLQAGGQIRSSIKSTTVGGGALTATRRAPRRARPSEVGSGEVEAGYTHPSVIQSGAMDSTPTLRGRLERPELRIPRETRATADVLSTTTAGREQTREVIMATERQQQKAASEKKGTGGGASKSSGGPIDRVSWVIDDMGILAVNGDMF